MAERAPDPQRAAQWLRERDIATPDLVCVAGSGLGEIARMLRDVREIPYRDIPGWTSGSIAGHAGCLRVGHTVSPSGAEALVAALCGRAHLYEGISPERAQMPIATMAALGARRIVLTCAAGGLRPEWRAGEIVLIDDILDLQRLSPWARMARPDACAPSRGLCFDAALRKALCDAAARAGTALRRGVYASVPGPNYETRAEIRMLRRAGADLVGMSLVWEIAAARSANIALAAIALVANTCIETRRAGRLSHEEVLEAGRTGGERLARIVMDAPLPVTHKPSPRNGAYMS